MNKLTFALVAAMSLATFGCKKKGGSDAIAKMEGFQKSMCECKDKACADKVNADMTAWGTEMAKTANKEEKPDPELAKKSADIMTKYTECMTKAMSGGGAKTGDTNTGSGATPPPTAKAGCVEGAWKDPSGTYCVKVPEGYTPPKESSKNADRTWDQFATEESVGNFGIKVWTKQSASFANLKASHMTDGNGAKIVESGEFANGDGWYVKTRREADKETYTSSVLKAGEKVIECEAMATDAKPLKPEDACRTVRAL